MGTKNGNTPVSKGLNGNGHAGNGAARPERASMPPAPGVPEALARLPGGLYVMTSAFDGARQGVCVRWVQQCAGEPACISVALFKGHPISPIIRDSRAFALCAISEQDRLLVRSFEHTHIRAAQPPGGPVPPPASPTAREDAFLSFETETLLTGAPVLKRSALVLDCRVMMHLDFESDHELYIGEVVAARAADAGACKPDRKSNGK